MMAQSDTWQKLTQWAEKGFDTLEPVYRYYTPKQYLTLFVIMLLASLPVILIGAFLELLGVLSGDAMLRHLLFVWFEFALVLVVLFGGWVAVLFGYSIEQPNNTDQPSTTNDTIAPDHKPDGHQLQDPANQTAYQLTWYEQLLKIRPPTQALNQQDEAEQISKALSPEMHLVSQTKRDNEIETPAIPFAQRLVAFGCILLYTGLIVIAYGALFNGAPYMASGLEPLMLIRLG